jgi:hypothetical protein
MMEKTVKKIFFNKKQQYIMHIGARILYVIASRRFGKSEGVIMPVLLRNIQQMPRGQHAILANTYKQALTRTLPGTIHAFNRMGYHEGVHFYLGRKAPDKAGFALPYIQPKDWTHYMHWYNGSVCPIISQDVAYSSNSLTLSSLTVDEAKVIDYPKLVDQTLPAITPMVYYNNSPWDGAQTYVSDMPTNKSGLWLLNKEKEMNPEIIKLVEGLLVELYQTRQNSTNSFHYRRKIKQLNDEIAFWRKESVLFVVADILDNLEIVGESYVKDRYRDLPMNRFLTAIMSYKLKLTEGGFYAALSEKHYYTAYDINFLSAFRKDDGSIDYYRASMATFNCSQDTDLDKNAPLYIALDTNININWLVVGQPDYSNRKLKVIKSFYAKHPRMLQEVCEDFAEYYAAMPQKRVVFYFDQTFLQGRSATNRETFHETICRVLRQKGFVVTDVYVGQAMKHSEKHKEIDSGLKGQHNLMPMFNRLNNEDLITALEKTGTVVSREGWGKDKSGEKDPDCEENPVEHRTDGTDAFDTLYIGCNFFRADHVQMGISTKMHY